MEEIISCNGGDPVLGHPKVYIKVKHGETSKCPYCNRDMRFLYASSKESKGND